MDNITHSLIGGLLGLHVARRVDLPARPIVLAAVLSSNFPDSDILYSSWISQPFGYLLHHRGHTHTILGALVCALASWLIIAVVYRVFRSTLSGRMHATILAVTLLGALLHIGFDWLNTYGIHPFWPLNNSWYYGDTVFIIEPTLWIALGFAVLPFARTPLQLLVALVPPLLGTVLIVALGKVPLEVIVAIYIIAVIIYGSVRKCSVDLQSKMWAAVAIAVLGIFGVMGNWARTEMKRRFGPEVVTLAAFVQPAPANPLCWSYFHVAKEDQDIVYRRGSIEPFHAIYPLQCEQYALFRGATSIASEELIRLPLKQIEGLSQNCRWKAFLQFARLPAVTECEEGGLCTTDLRFSRGSRTNFSTHRLEGECPSMLPPWLPPVEF